MGDRERLIPPEGARGSKPELKDFLYKSILVKQFLLYI